MRGLKVIHILLLFCIGMIALSGCRKPESGTLRIAVLPILDTLPLYVAEIEGYFAAQGITVDLIPAAAAAERDQLLQAGQIDGFITDLVALALYNRDTTQVVAVRYAMVPTANFAQFRILAAAQSGITTVEGLRDVPVGVSEGTVIEYVTHRLLEAAGLPTDEIATLAVPKIPDRMALLGAGELSAATLPEPLASLAMQQGAIVITDDTAHPEISCSVYAFHKDVIDQHPQTVRAFLAAIDEASDAINGDKSRWSDLLADKGLVPAPLAGAYILPDYPANAVPTEAQFANAVSWLQATGRLTATPMYKDSVDGKQ
ncbi:MAG: ABC transporter substrate-binding protein [Anaerolineae bacterium]|nr:ABC transporter substrate-binding protein [Anaerolineae bacterium]